MTFQFIVSIDAMAASDTSTSSKREIRLEQQHYFLLSNAVEIGIFKLCFIKIFFHRPL